MAGETGDNMTLYAGGRLWSGQSAAFTFLGTICNLETDTSRGH